jgi:hypothetical protein
VLDCLAEANRLRPVFEPLHQSVTPIGAKYAYRVLPSDAECPDLAQFLLGYDTGTQRSIWTTYRGRPDLLMPGVRSLGSMEELRRLRRRWVKFLRGVPGLRAASRQPGSLIKDIRFNLCLGWMVRALAAKAVLVVRHPCAVVESQFRLGQPWDPEPILRRYQADPHLSEFTGGRYDRLLHQPLDRLEALTLLWLIENQVPEARSAELGYVIIYYEDLLDHDEEGWRLMARALGLANIPPPALLRRPSQQATAGGSVRGDLLRPAWMAALAGKQLGSIQRMLDAAEYATYNVTTSLPVRTC